jgi:phage RecT family recombinase
MSTSNLREAAARQGVATRQKTIIDILRDDKIAKGLRGVATKYLTPERMLRLAVNAVSRTPGLQHCDPQTVLGAIMASTALGLEPNTPEGQAYLIPYKRRAKVGNQWVDVWDCQFQIGYRGFITLAYRLPGLQTLQAEAIHQHDRFQHQLGSETFLRYEKTLDERGDLRGAFCYTRINGGEAATILPLAEIMKIRGRSETYKALTGRAAEARSTYEADQNAKAKKDLDYAAAKLADTPWEMWEDDMAAKSAVKKHCKKLPKALGMEGTALNVAADIDQDTGRLIDISAMADPERAAAVARGEEAIPEEREHGAVTHEPGEKLEIPLDTREREKVQRGEASGAEQQRNDDAGEGFGGMKIE